MEETKDLKLSLIERSGLTRRHFLKGVSTLGAVSALYGCSRNDSDTDYIVVDDPADPDSPETYESTYIYGSGLHNCGGRCVSRAEVSNGRILRILTDESKFTGDGIPLTAQTRNHPQTRACARCRGYRYRIYHPGRLKYPMKQTRKRGDLNGFQRISWEQAMTEIAAKHKNVLDTHGPDGVYNLYSTGASSSYQGGGAITSALRYMGGIAGYTFGSYSSHQNTYFGTGYTGMNNSAGANAINSNFIAQHTKTLVLWGDNSISTRNNCTFAAVQTIEDMKKRDADAQVIYIGPEFSDGGVTTADEWVISKPFTDPALIAGMIYHMLDNTFDLNTGALRTDQTPWLDVDYLDTMVYGFFDSPAYLLEEDTGTINADPAAQSTVPPGWRNVEAVPPGRSYCSWILGSGKPAPTYTQLGSNTNYTAKQYAETNPAFARWADCSYPVTKLNSTVYKTKQDYTTPKTPRWASLITGVPEEDIKRLAETFIKNRPVASVWSGGQQKQAEGVTNLYAVHALQIITKNVSEYGSVFGWYLSGNVIKVSGGLNSISLDSRTYPNSQVKPRASCTAWHTTIKAAFAEELMRNGYRAKYIPNWKPANDGLLEPGGKQVYWDDAGSKAAVIRWKRNANGSVKEYSDGTYTYYDWEGRDETKNNTPDAHDGTPVIAGIRLMYNSAGNIFVNQHENSNDSREILEYLNLNNPNDGDSFCLVTFDNFLTPTARWSDYVLPGSTTWEQQNFISPNAASDFYTPQATPPPGEAKPAWDYATELLRAYGKLDSSAANAAKNYNLLPDNSATDTQSVEGLAKTEFNKLSQNVSSPFYGKSWEEYLNNPCLVAKPNDTAAITPGAAYEVKQKYNRLTAAEKRQPLITLTNNMYVNTNEYYDEGYGAEYATDVSKAPKASLRYQVCSPVMVWHYENRFNKWHGYLPKEQRGQHNTDFEGDPLVLPIPLYYAYQDYFMEAYGNDPAKVEELDFLLTTTHNRYRSHSTLAENPFMRELNHRVPGRDEKGEFIQANDYGHYAMGPDQAFEVNNASGSIPCLAGTINDDGSVDEDKKHIASYSEIWINTADGHEILDIEDGDLVQVENPIGAVRCVARLTYRCARGFVGLHQGNWYDPRPIANSFYGHDNVDVGGNANTLMASQPSRIDHGNGQQSAMVRIFKVNY